MSAGRRWSRRIRVYACGAPVAGDRQSILSGCCNREPDFYPVTLVHRRSAVAYLYRKMVSYRFSPGFGSFTTRNICFGLKSGFQVLNGVNASYKDLYRLPRWESDLYQKSCVLIGERNFCSFLDVVVRKRSSVLQQHSVEDEVFFTCSQNEKYSQLRFQFNLNWIFLLRGINPPSHRRALRLPIVSLRATSSPSRILRKPPLWSQPKPVVLSRGATTYISMMRGFRTLCIQCSCPFI